MSSEHLLDFLSRYLGAMGQSPYFVSNYRKPTALIACACCIESSVQSQKVGLFCNRPNHLNNFSDALCTI